MKPPVYLRLCTNEMKIVSAAWWDRFLLRQELALSKKKNLDNDLVPVRTSSVEGTSTEQYVRQV